MSDLSATSCGCGCDNGCNNGCGSSFFNFGGGNSCIWIILLLVFCGGCGNGGGFLGGGGCGCDNGCNNGGNCCSLIIWLLILSCLCGGGSNGCGNGCGCGNSCC